MTAPQNPMEMIAAARARLDRRTIQMFWIPTDERLEAQQAGEDVFDDVAGVGLIPLAHNEQAAIMRRLGGKDSADIGTALLAESMRAVVIGGPMTVVKDGREVFVEPEENPTAPTKLETSADAMKVILRMSPITLARALDAYCAIHMAKEKNTQRFLERRTYIAG